LNETEVIVKKLFWLEFSYLKGEELWKSKCLRSQNQNWFISCTIFASIKTRM